VPAPLSGFDAERAQRLIIDPASEDEVSAADAPLAATG